MGGLVGNQLDHLKVNDSKCDHAKLELNFFELFCDVIFA